MRIAFLSWESLYSIRVGGLSIVATRQAEELAKRGHEVHMFTRWRENQTPYSYINGVHYHRCIFNPGNNIIELAYNMSKAMVSSLHETEKYHGRFDVIHGHDWHVVQALHDLKEEGRDIVLTFHSTEYGRNGNHFGGWWEFQEISGKEWYGAYIANRVTTVSNTMKNEINWLYKTPLRKIVVIPNGIDFRNYQARVDPDEIKAKYGIPKDRTIIMYVGRIVYQKGTDLLVEAIPSVVKFHPQAFFVFAGEGDMRPHLEWRVHSLGIADRAKFLGEIPYWDFIKLLNVADIVCIPSRNEPFGLVLLEAWATGKPVVVSNVGGLGENVENFVNGIKVQPNPEAIAWGITYLMDHPDLAEELRKNAFEKSKEFDWSKIVERLVRAYELAMVV